MSEPALLDTSVLIRHVMGDHLEHSPRATALIRDIEEGRRSVRLSETIMFKTVFTLEKPYKVSRQTISDGVLALMALPGIVLPGKRMYPGVFELWVANQGLSFADSYHLCLARHLNLEGVISFDRKMNRLPGVELLEP
jgi:predicted nucleic acid-binding protein